MASNTATSAVTTPAHTNHPSMQDVKEAFRGYTLQTQSWTLQGLRTWVRVVDCYDADTLTIIVPCKGDYLRYSSRVFGIDTSEMKSKLAENKLAAVRARNRMLQLCGVPNVALDRSYTRKEVQAMLQGDVFLVWVECGEFDKYGRVLVKVFRAPEDATPLGDVLIAEKLAYPYYGDTKLTETQQNAYRTDA